MTSVLSTIHLLRAALRKGTTGDGSEESRSAQRYRHLVLTAGTSAMTKVVTAATTLITVPLALNYLGTERYGLWMAISSIMAMLTFADLGMGNGLLNAIAEADGKGDRAAARRSVSSAFFVLSSIAAGVIGITALLGPVLPWPRIFNVTSHQAMQEAAPTAIVLAICFALNLPLDMVQRVQYGFQEGFRNNLWQCGAAVAGLVAVVVAVREHVGLPALVAALAGTPLAIQTLNWLTHFTVIRPWLFPRLRHLHWPTAASLTRTGLSFLVLNACIILGYSSDSIIITQMLGPAAVADYAIVQKLFYSTHVSEFFIAPLWPAFGEALARGDHNWIRKTIVGSLKIHFAITGATGLALLLCGRWLIGAWTLSRVSPAWALLASFAVWRMLSVYQGTMSTFLNHGELLRRQMGFFGAASICSLGLKVVFVRWYGVSGVVWATVFAFGIIYAPAAWRLAFGYLNKCEAEHTPILATPTNDIAACEQG